MTNALLARVIFVIFLLAMVIANSGCNRLVGGQPGRTAAVGGANEREKLEREQGERRDVAADPDEQRVPDTTQCMSDTPMPAPDTEKIGLRSLDEALAVGNARSVQFEAVKQAILKNLRDARDCFSRTLHLAPNSYVASLGMGVAYVVGASLELNQKDPNRQLAATYLVSARRFLGKAYALRQGPFDPVYYLAATAILEGDLARAERFLSALEKSSFRRGSVYALRGYLSERQGRTGAARDQYQAALDLGASEAEMEWAFERLEALKGK